MSRRRVHNPPVFIASPVDGKRVWCGQVRHGLTMLCPACAASIRRTKRALLVLFLATPTVLVLAFAPYLLLIPAAWYGWRWWSRRTPSV